MNKKHFP